MAKRIALLLLCLFALNAAAAVEIVAPAEILHDADLGVRVTGLEPGSTVDLQSDFVTPGATVWRSTATYTADATGAIVPPDPHAFIWSMEKTKELPSTTAVIENDDRSIITVRVLREGKPLAEKRITLLKRAPGISTTEIRDPKVVGTFCQPFGKRSLPALIILGGSEGGISRWEAALLASHGYAALAVAYFGIDPLPQLLDRIPVETIDRAVDWLRAQPSVDPKRIAIIGGSKGAELALLAASMNPAIRAVVASAPSSVVFQSITYGKGGLTSSWTAAGKEVPFAKYVSTDQRLVDMYKASLTAAPPDAAIAVEKISGPVFLVAGKQDMLWPSAEMAAQLVARANAKHFRYPVTNRTIDDVGHHALHIPNRPTADSVRLGGTPQSLFEAQMKSWQAMLDFLRKAL